MPSVERELEADRFAGAVMRALFDHKGYLDDTLQDVKERGAVQFWREMEAYVQRPDIRDGGATHPSGPMRLEALKIGFLHGPGC